jgi:choline-sulfatase
MAEQPNILVIMSDDHAQWASGCYGNQELHTPTLDYLASTGVRMENAFTPTPVCSPARASFFTGRLPSQHGIHDWLQEVDETVKQRDWMEGETTLAQFLADAGYQTALVGKWHCGRGTEAQPGFEHWCSFGHRQTVHRGEHTYWCNGQPRSLTGNTTQVVTDLALDFLRTRDTSRPFFLFVGYVATHSPWIDHPERLVARYNTATFRDIPVDIAYPFGRIVGKPVPPGQREALAQYYAAVSEIDEQVGRIVDYLAANSLTDSSLLVYLADHGLNCGHHGIWGKGNGTRPLNMLEESIRIPLLFHGLSQLFPGLVRGEFVDHCDIFQTLLDCAGVTLPEDMAIQQRYPGQSFLHLLQGDFLADWKTENYGEYGNLRMIRTCTHKLVRRYPTGPCELFDLSADPRETTNLFYLPEAQSLVQVLTEHLEAFFALHEDPDKSGLRVNELPRHNHVEAWRGM